MFENAFFCMVNTPLWSSTFQQNQEMNKKKHLDPRKLTWNLKIPLWKRRKSYKTPIFGFHVSFPGVKQQSVRFILVPTIPQISENCRKLPVQMGEITTVSMVLPENAFVTCWNLSPLHHKSSLHFTKN